MSELRSPEAGPALAPDTVISLDNVSVRYWLHSRRVNSLQRYLWDLARGRLVRRPFWALRQVTLTVRRGEVFGVIGPNGAGKSTLLAVVGGMIEPVSGRVIARGHIVALLQPGAGLEMELTGRENILLKSAMLGFSEADTRSRLDGIIDFAELREFIDEPLRTYSSGMVARLAFATITDVRPDILLLDEVLAVGDTEFQLRSRDRMFELRRQGTTILFVSHDVTTVQTLCDRAVWLSYGRAQLVDVAPKVIHAYLGMTTAALGGSANGQESGWSSTLARHLRPDQTVVYFRMPGINDGGIERALTSEFEPDRTVKREPSNGNGNQAGAVVSTRLMSGPFYYDQIIQQQQVFPMGLATIGEPVRAALAVWKERTGAQEHDLSSLRQWAAEPSNLVDISNPLTRRLGIRIPSVAGAPATSAYTQISPDSTHLARARDVLGAFAFVGLAECPKESRLLLAYTLGQKLSDPGTDGEQPSTPEAPLSRSVQDWLGSLNDLDMALYRFGRDLFDARFRQMQRELAAYEQESSLPEGDPLNSLEALLERNLFERGQAHRDKPEKLRYSFDHPVPGRGWYAAEYSPVYGAFRWMGPEERASLQLQVPDELRGCDLEFRCHLLMAITPQLLLSWRLAANDSQIPLTPLPAPDGSIVYHGIIPKSVFETQPIIHMLFQVDSTYSPAEVTPGSNDRRRLGLAFTWVELSARKVQAPAAQ